MYPTDYRGGGKNVPRESWMYPSGAEKGYTKNPGADQKVNGSLAISLQPDEL